VTDSPTYVVFSGDHRIGRGSLVDAAIAAKRATDDSARTAQVFNLETGAPIDLDLRGSFAAVRSRYMAPAPAAPPVPARGRPKLGVVAREVTLLPRHWEWLARQPGGASAALRRMVEAARKVDDPSGDRQVARDAAYRLMSALAGDRAGFEEASRALYRGDEDTLGGHMSAWPPDIRLQILERLRR
jgi:hypothetical protein